jgi:hypothetical protein
MRLKIFSLFALLGLISCGSVAMASYGSWSDRYSDSDWDWDDDDDDDDDDWSDDDED